MQPKAIVMDLDGTLLNSKKQISEATFSALKEIANQRIELFFATARPPRALLDMDFISLGTAVYYNGAFFTCRKTKKDIHYAIPKKKAKEFIDVILEMDNRADISIEVKDTWYSHKEINYEKRMGVKENPQQITYKELVSYDCTKILISDFDFPNEIIERYEKDFTIHITDSGSLIQVMSIDASKEAAVEYLIQRRGIDMEDVMCFGDDVNDIGLFVACGYPVAMGNAVDELKQLAKEVTLSNDEEGVRIVLERLM